MIQDITYSQYMPSSVGRNDRPSVVGASADCSVRMKLICNSEFHLHDVAAVKQALLVQKMDLDSASCSVSMEVPTICDDSPQVYITYSSIHFLTVARGMLPNRMSGVIQVLLNQMFFNTSTRGDSAEPG